MIKELLLLLLLLPPAHGSFEKHAPTFLREPMVLPRAAHVFLPCDLLRESLRDGFSCVSDLLLIYA